MNTELFLYAIYHKGVFLSQVFAPNDHTAIFSYLEYTDSDLDSYELTANKVTI